MARLSSHFNEEQMISFLERRGFRVLEVTCWESYNTYHNNVEYKDIEVKIAYKGEFPNDVIEDNNQRLVEGKYGYQMVFEKEMEYKMLYE